MAYLKNYTRECQFASCTKRATKTLMSRFNEEFGCFCTKHAGQRLIQLKRDEQPQK